MVPFGGAEAGGAGGTITTFPVVFTTQAYGSMDFGKLNGDLDVKGW